MINSWISPGKNVNYKRIYRATENGDKASDFHRLCNNKVQIFIIVKSKGGYIFGGFIYAKLDKKKSNIIDPNGFVFSLNQKKYFKTKDEKAFCIREDYGPKFGYLYISINIQDNILSNPNHRINPNGTYGKNLQLAESEYFSINELEAFIVEF